MKNFKVIEKRLESIKKNIKSPNTPYKLKYCSRTSATAYVLTGMPNDSNVVELHWSNEPKTRTDAEKLRWLGQYNREQLAEIRADWESSSSRRDKAALEELNRLQQNQGGFDAIRQSFLRRRRAAESNIRGEN